MTYLVEEYRADTAGYNVTASVHVEACWSGDPVNETKLVLVSKIKRKKIHK